MHDWDTIWRRGGALRFWGIVARCFAALFLLVFLIRRARAPMPGETIWEFLLLAAVSALVIFSVIVSVRDFHRWKRRLEEAEAAEARGDGDDRLL